VSLGRFDEISRNFIIMTTGGRVSFFKLDRAGVMA